MKPTKLFLALAVAVLLGACGNRKAIPTSFIVEGILKDSTANGLEIYIYNHDNRTFLDTAIVKGKTFCFTGVADSAIFCQIFVDGYRQEGFHGTFILENGHIKLNLADAPHKPSGTPYNEELKRINELADSIRDLTDSRDIFRLYGQRLFAEHSNDVIGYAMLSSPFLNQAGTKREKCTLLQDLGPDIKNTQQYEFRLKMYQTNVNVGKPFKDIQGVDIEGNPIALSDFVGDDKFLLVDMWASWCTPCKEEIPYIAKVFEKYRDKGLSVVGIFTWDKAENLPEALNMHPVITWPQIIDVGNTALKLYDVPGIPALILIAPDGTTIELDTEFRGEEMVRIVGEYLEGEKQ